MTTSNYIGGGRQSLSGGAPTGKASVDRRVHTDTTDFFQVQYGDVLLLGGKQYLIRHNAREGRFGLDDEVKFWVKSAIEISSHARKIIKLVFYERFTADVGGVRCEFFRSPRKEARILDLVSGHGHFMQGFSIKDNMGNLVRIVDFIRGHTLSSHVEQMDMDHETYFFNRFPEILDRFLECVEAVRFLHEHGEKHGDIRRDHIIVDRDSRKYRLIDFDFNYRHNENIYAYDLFGLGNVLVFLAAKGDILVPEIRKQGHAALGKLTNEDVNIIFNYRVVNLGKIYPYIPTSLNRVLMHFSKGANWFYENTTQILDDLGECREGL